MVVSGLLWYGEDNLVVLRGGCGEERLDFIMVSLKIMYTEDVTIC